MPGRHGSRGTQEARDGMRRLIPSLAGLVVVALAAAACTGQSGSASTRDAASRRLGSASGAATTPSSTVTPAGSAPVTVYYPRDTGDAWYLVEERHQVPSDVSRVVAAVTDLLTVRPRYAGSSPPFPAGSRLLGADVRGTTAVVDLSREAVRVPRGEASEYALQALVWTVTRAEQVRRVVVEVEGRTSGEVDGRPLSDLLGRGGPAGLVSDPRIRLAPVSLVEPTPGARVEGGRIVVKGDACVVQGIVSLRLWDSSGVMMAQGFATADGTAPRRAPFTAALAFDPPLQDQAWTLEVFEADPKDGTVRYSVLVPVKVGP